MNTRQRLIVTDWINSKIDRIFWNGVGIKNHHHMIWTMLHAADADFSYPEEDPSNSPMHHFSRTSLFDLFGEEEARQMIDAARGIDAPPRIVSGN
jgi:hypothetical protein